MNESVFSLSLRDIKRTFVQGDRRLDVLKGITLDLKPGEIVALVGQSGSGKSTVLHISGLLERPDGGDVVVDGKGAGDLGDQPRTILRRRFLGHAGAVAAGAEGIVMSRNPPAEPGADRRSRQ